MEPLTYSSQTGGFGLGGPPENVHVYQKKKNGYDKD
jgi:hypothetical protein